MGGLILATSLMAATHLAPALPGLRDGLRRRLGAGLYGALHGTLSLLALALLVLVWRQTDPVPSPLDGGAAAKTLAAWLMPLALFLVVARLTTRRADGPHGIYTMTATPGSLGVMLWSLLHLGAASDGRAAVVFAGFALIAAVSLWRNLRDAPPAVRAVGWMPFAGAGPVDWRGIGLWRMAAALLSWGLLLWAHPFILGPDPAAYLGP
ncbi:NnrU family protein [Rhodospirillum centenum]|uniref:NnrU protein, putative n=1 Tax=Rhodospirillum centenum (strain ATCC 51521 / SW) TaxID=414684 RepID=B6IPB8_RHOCS|nr:NnrU family protein [Rhodospirillum centenum]ACI99620.1 NnrU protein, putative [Rhodospirillum centenum SW]